MGSVFMSVFRFFQERAFIVWALVMLALVTLPLVVWLDLRSLSDQNLARQAKTLNTVVTAVRGYYTENVAGRVLTSDGQTRLMHNYRDEMGAIPIPATLSIELGEVIGAAEGDVAFRFVSDYPFANREAHALSAFEQRALASFRNGKDMPGLVRTSGNILDRSTVLATPVLMDLACVACHNSHPESTRQDWKVGDVRGIQTVRVSQPIALNLASFRFSLAYLVLAGTFGLLFAWMQARLVRDVGQVNAELEQKNAFLAGVSNKISKYLPPQVYGSIFSGERETNLTTERKKLTVFFSDIKDFTLTSEELQPEELTVLLNEYFTEMSSVAERHGATIDKFIGDAMVAFFGDPETRGTAEDARACIRMAIEMQHRLADLAERWRLRGIEHAFRTRIGINTGYCNVGNFGSEERMDYTIIGAEANLAARLQQIAEPGGIVVSYETYALVRNIVEGRALAPVAMKGIAREVVPYEIVVPDRDNPDASVTDVQTQGLSLRLDVSALDETGKAAAREALRKALLRIESTRGGR